MRVVQMKVEGCEKCSSLFNKEGRVKAVSSAAPGSEEEADEEKEEMKSQLREMELELAQTKLQLVEAECKIQVGVYTHTRHTRNTHALFSDVVLTPRLPDPLPRIWSTTWGWLSTRSRSEEHTSDSSH